MQQFLNNVNQLERTLSGDGAQNILLITGPHSYEQSGASAQLEPLLRKHRVFRFDTVSPNPQLNEIEPVVNLYKEHNIDLLIALGGGSVIDVAKTARLLAAQEGSLDEIVKNNTITNDPTGVFVAIPTTAGSGAESTHFAVVYIDKQKYSPAHTKALADIVVLDPRLTYSLSPHATAASGMDAIAQAIEAYWSVKSTEESMSLSRRALDKLLPNIERVVLSPAPESREAMLEGANLAGQAINIAMTTAPHALSYGFTANYGLDHGEAVSLTLPYFMAFNYNVSEADCQDSRGVQYIRNRIDEIVEMFGVANIGAASKKVEELITKIGLKRNLNVRNTDEAVTRLSKSIKQDRLKNNPRSVSITESQKIIKSIVV